MGVAENIACAMALAVESRSDRCVRISVMALLAADATLPHMIIGDTGRARPTVVMSSAIGPRRKSQNATATAQEAVSVGCFGALLMPVRERECAAQFVLPTKIVQLDVEDDTGRAGHG